MDKAKAAVSSFLSKDGKHDTTVHETVNPAVQQEKVTNVQHNEARQAIDREVHQDHHHTSVQPISDREVLPEMHTHNLAQTEHREIQHGNDDHIKQKLAAEQAQFKNTREVGETQVTNSSAPTVAGEHVHHHVHESIQPVIQKETIQPSVVHTTVPIHEVHHNEAKHHAATQLPAVTMNEFQKQGGSIAGRDERSDAFAGEPKTVGSTIGGHGAAGTTSLTGNTAEKTGSGYDSTTATGSSTGSSGTGYDNTSNTHGKPSLMDKLNPKKDTTGDGKPGFMS